jgi:hypothetical protein
VAVFRRAAPASDRAGLVLGAYNALSRERFRQAAGPFGRLPEPFHDATTAALDALTDEERRWVLACEADELGERGSLGEVIEARFGPLVRRSDPAPPLRAVSD